MNRNLLLAVFGGALLLNAGSLLAQEPPPDAMGPGGPGGRMELLGFNEMHPGKVVTGAPYSATASVVSSQTLADGTAINRNTQSQVYRDSQGRTRREVTMPAGGPLATGGQSKTVIMIHDPVAGAAYILHPDTKIAEKLPAPPSGANAKAPSADVQSRFEAHMQQEIANGTLKKDDLGTQTMDGISAQGTRYTRTIPAGQIGNDKPITVISESWYSPDLQIVVKTSRTDPRFGTSSYSISSLQRTEPAASLFTVPSDYTVQAAKPHGHGGHPGGPGPSASEVPPPPLD